MPGGSNDGSTPPPSGGLKDFASVITSVAALVAALAGLITGIVAYKNSDQANTKADKAQHTANSASFEASTPPKPPGPVISSAPTSGSDNILVQLATYQVANCTGAQEEINSYRDQFSPQPTLWREPTGRFTVIAIKAPNNNAADALKSKAESMAKSQDFPGTDLGNARIRINPGWTAFPNCPPT